MNIKKFLPPLPEIDHHSRLPNGMDEIGALRDSETTQQYFLYKYRKNLIVFRYRIGSYKGAEEYIQAQIDLPLGFLDWFPTELIDYRKPPSEGGATEFHMTPGDKVVEGETLCIIREMGDRNWPASGPPPGYAVENASRQTHMGFDDSQTMSFSEHFLFEGGFLDLIRRLGAQYKAGLL
ncbi:hypothetical protein [Isoalcanivorax indicus]|uniref:hypothetical protein n=1 Tax=Isoalcanivorax indicus TaxID=2202653 RepID=UPI0013C4066D|nr:hypothetical protein [Isoalcanivorax indicus]